MTVRDDAEFSWLIERADSQACAPLYLGVNGSGIAIPETCVGTFYWTPNHHDALRFSRRLDAVLCVGAMRSLSGLLPHAMTLGGLRSGDVAPRVCEHGWIDPLPAAPATKEGEDR